MVVVPRGVTLLRRFFFRFFRFFRLGFGSGKGTVPSTSETRS